MYIVRRIWLGTVLLKSNLVWSQPPNMGPLWIFMGDQAWNPGAIFKIDFLTSFCCTAFDICDIDSYYRRSFSNHCKKIKVFKKPLSSRDLISWKGKTTQWGSKEYQLFIKGFIFSDILKVFELLALGV